MLVSMRGGGRPRQVHIFEVYRLFFSLLFVFTPLKSCHKHDLGTVSTEEFEKPTSAPLITPVDTITPVPLLYNVRTFYIVRYSSFTTYPSQPIYTVNELQKRKTKKPKD